MRFWVLTANGEAPVPLVVSRVIRRKNLPDGIVCWLAETPRRALPLVLRLAGDDEYSRLIDEAP